MITKAKHLLSIIDESINSVKNSEVSISKEEQDQIVKDNFRPEYQDKWKNGTASKFVNKKGHSFVAITSSSGTHLFQKSAGSKSYFTITASPENERNHALLVDKYTKDMDSDKRFN